MAKPITIKPTLIHLGISVVNRIPKNFLPCVRLRYEMPAKNKLYISIDSFGRWPITEPLNHFKYLRNERFQHSLLSRKIHGLRRTKHQRQT